MENIIVRSLEKLIRDIDGLLDISNNRFKELDEFILFGASGLGKEGLECLANNKKTASYFCDNDQNKWGKEFHGVKIVDPDELMLMDKNSPIIITSTYYEEILDQLKSMNIANEIFIFRKLNNEIIDPKGYFKDEIFSNKTYRVLYWEKVYELNKIIKDYNESFINEIQPELHKTALKKVTEKVSKGKKIKVAFFVLSEAVWKYEGVYRLLEKDDRFEPLIIICPIGQYDEEYILEVMRKTYNYFSKRDYNVINAYNEVEDTYLDIRKEIMPDIIFYTNPYKASIHEKYYITEFMDILTCYVNYFYGVLKLDGVINSMVGIFAWKYFFESIVIKKIAETNSKNNINGVVTGYPKLDDILYGRKVNNLDENLNDRVIHIIWAPHQSIGIGPYTKRGTFLKYCANMLLLANKYKEKIRITFKPHPGLKIQLYNHEDWGKERTDAYYKRWEMGENTQIVTGDYVELFNFSDGLIHDSGSFTGEYLYCGKPALFLMGISSRNDFNEFGNLALDQHYHAYNEEDIENFIVDVLLNGNDVMKESRDKFYKGYLEPRQGLNASLNIYNHICDEILGNK